MKVPRRRAGTRTTTAQDPNIWKGVLFLQHEQENEFYQKSLYRSDALDPGRYPRKLRRLQGDPGGR